MSIRKILLAPIAAVICGVVVNAVAQTTAPPFAHQDSATVAAAVERFLQRETIGLPGTVNYSVGALDARTTLAACPTLEAFLPVGARLWGNSTVGVRCVGGTTWTVYVPVTVRVIASYLVTARPLGQGQTIAAIDLAMLNGDLTQLPAGIVTDPRQATGRMLAISVTAGQPLRQDMLRMPLAVQQGQTVRLMTTGHGFQVTAEGRAVNNAADGQLAKVQTASGQTVSGIAHANSVVEVSF